LFASAANLRRAKIVGVGDFAALGCGVVGADGGDRGALGDVDAVGPYCGGGKAL
jgi:hypothetical protein